ncbi:flavodoxin [Ancylomarina sp. 16SWW S1-10-2]|uniref:flavodoxin n=1 Tax=Ancylomarina sp. 16SWW S1-10-2 TaxID=2499681 RepID=UPI0012AE1943|nr:flavodoxin [Ancylomarina sp. 16SWW S1-10-2]MRT91340.1 flavodoxin [Ancylomarina sp. 16SWW S1-10-2]
MTNIGLFYGPTKGNVEKVAKLIASKIGNVDLVKVKDADSNAFDKYDHIILGISTLGKHTWSSDNAGNDWDQFLPNLTGVDLKGKKVAIFGLGDHLAYADFFVDAMGELYDVVKKTGATVIGSVSDEGYQFNESRAIVEGKFVGLPIDEDFEDDLTEERVDNWLKIIQPEMK